MCFSFEASLLTGLFSWSVCFYLWGRGGLTQRQSHEVLFLFLFSSMQWVEAVLWYTEMQKNTLNYVLTSFVIPLLLLSQIVHNMFFFQSLYTHIGVILLVLGYAIFLFHHYQGYTIPSNNRLGSPIWGGKEMSLPFVLVFFFLIVYGRIGLDVQRRMFTLAAVIILGLPYLFSGGFGSLWCAFANIYAVHLLLTF